MILTLETKIMWNEVGAYVEFLPNDDRAKNAAYHGKDFLGNESEVLALIEAYMEEARQEILNVLNQKFPDFYE